MRLVVLSGVDRKFLLDDVAGDIRTPTYALDGWIVYTRQKTEQALYAVPFSLDSLSVTGPPINLVGHATAPTVSVDGTLAHRSGTWAMPTDLVLVDRTGRKLASAGDLAADIRMPVFSPTGNRVAFAAYETATCDIRVRDLERSTETRVSQSGLMNTNPVWSPDGTRLGLVWRLASWAVHRPILPAPLVVVQVFAVEIVGDMGLDFLASLGRVVASMALAVLTAVPAGLALGQMPALNRFFSPVIYIL